MSLCKDSRPLFSAPSAKRNISFPEARVKQRIFLPYSFFLRFAVTLISDTSDRPAVSSPTLRGKAFNDLSKSAGRWLVLHDASSRVTRRSPGGPELPAGGWQADCLRRARCLDNRLLASFEGVEKEMCCPLHFLPTLLFFSIFLGFVWYEPQCCLSANFGLRANWQFLCLKCTRTTGGALHENLKIMK